MKSHLRPLIGFVVAITAAVAEADVIYVDRSAAEGGDGSSWASAHRHLQDGLGAARLSDEVWVAQGTYLPDRGSGMVRGDAAASFQLRNSVALYGGFPAGGGDGTFAARTAHPANNGTILSGDLGGDDPVDGENSHHVLTTAQAIGLAVLDGFTIEGGRAPGLPPLGGGLFCPDAGSPIIANCLFRANGGAAVFCASLSSPNFNNCVFSSGSAVHTTGGAHPTFVDCLFHRNAGTFSAQEFGQVTMTGCTFRSASTTSAILVESGSQLVATNCTFEDNCTGFRGGALTIRNRAGNVEVTNCVFRNNKSVSEDRRSGSGGAIQITEARGHIVITNCVFLNNRALKGGALFAASTLNRESWILANCTFQGNEATEGGGAIRNEVRFSTSAPNRPPLRLDNCVVWGNSSPSLQTGPAGSTIRFVAPIYHHSLVEGLDLTALGIGNFDGTSSASDPLFVGVALGDLRLGAASPALDAGNNTRNSQPADLAGAARIQNGTIDLGSYEGEVIEIDADGDMLPDWWEREHLPAGADLDDGSANPEFGKEGDFDQDGSSNFAELRRGTDPTDPDSDDDGLLDGVEDGTGVFVDAQRTGTDPLDPDTDDDLFPDNVETGTGIYENLARTGSNPNLFDSDRDFTPDGSEPALGRDPNTSDAPPLDLRSSLVNYWDFDANLQDRADRMIGTASSVRDDGSIAGLNGTDGIGIAAGLFGSCISQDGAIGSAENNGFVQIPRSRDTLFGPNATNPGQPNTVTTSVWINADGFDIGSQTILAHGASGQILLERFRSDVPERAAYSGGTPGGAGTIGGFSGPTIAAGTGWHHIVGISNHLEGAQIWVNGELVAVYSSRAVIRDSEGIGLLDLHIGASPVPSARGETQNREWFGRIDDAAQWNRALTPVEIQAVYHAGLLGRSLGLLISEPSPELRAFSTSWAGTQLEFSWNSLPGYRYDLLSSANLLSAPRFWTSWDGHESLAATPPRNSLAIPFPAESTRFFAVRRSPNESVTVFRDDFEGAAGAWSTNSNTGTAWELGSPANGPAGALSGTNCFGTDLSADYVAHTEASLRSPVIDLTNFARGTLTYGRWTNIRTQSDRASVRVLDAADGAVLAVLESSVGGSSNGWKEVTLPLPGGRAIQIEFRLTTEDSGLPGFFIDDVSVEGTPP